MKRVFILLLDSFGVGASHDAASFGDEGADTFGHIVEACAAGHGDKSGVRQGPLHIPHLLSRGLGQLAIASTGKVLPGIVLQDSYSARYGYAVEQSFGKDTPSGHWEIAGVPVLFDWGYFQSSYPALPTSLSDHLIARGEIPGLLANQAASGTEVIEIFGEEHIRTGKPIVYTSGDSVLQIAAHEMHFGLERLYSLCEIARELVDEYHIGRVIARPFVGTAGAYERTGNRRDYATPPPTMTLLDILKSTQREVIGIGKVSDIFAHSGFTQSIKAHGNHAIMDALLDTVKTAADLSLVFANFVDFDSLYGHRRDIPGYAHALESFDARLSEFDNVLTDDDLVIITADHGCDPTFPGSDHTREHIPIIAYGRNIKPQYIGRRETFADIGQTIAEYLNVSALDYGVSFL